jgi:hypothetical protein
MSRFPSRVVLVLLAATFLGHEGWSEVRTLSVEGAARQPFRGKIVSVEASRTGGLEVTLEVEGKPTVLRLLGLSLGDLPLDRCRQLEVTPKNLFDGPSILLAFLDADGNAVALVGINQRLGWKVLGEWTARAGSADSVRLAKPKGINVQATVGVSLAFKEAGESWSLVVRQVLLPLGGQLGDSDSSPFRYSYLLTQVIH